jgi:hypothetical protein
MQGQWSSIITQLYGDWKSDMKDLDKLLCIGTALWYYLVFENELDPKEKLSRVELLEQLTEVTQYGWLKFADQWVFNMFFGYMISMFPYFWGDWDAMVSKALEMNKRACELAPDNPIPKIWYYGSFSDSPYYINAKKDAQQSVTDSFPKGDNGNPIVRYFCDMLLP